MKSDCARTLALALAVAVGSTVAHADDCPHCSGAKSALCADHAESERRTIAAEQRAWKSADVAARLAALQAVAATTRGHENAPSPQVTTFLARGLQDDDLRVREEALRLLLDGQHPDGVVDALLDGLKAAESAWKAVESHLEDSRSAKAGKVVTVTKEELVYWTEVPTYVERLMIALGKVPDERVQKALVSFMKRPLGETPGAFFVAASRALLEQDSRAGVRAVIEFVPRLEKSSDTERKGRGDAGVGGGLRLVDVVAALYRPGGHAEAVRIESALSARAKAKGLPASPAKPGDWTGWLATHEGAFVADLGRLERPLKATLPPREPLAR